MIFLAVCEGWPRLTLNNRPVAIMIAEGLPVTVPVRINGGQTAKSGGKHIFAGGEPGFFVRQIQHQHIFLRGCWPQWMRIALGKFEMPGQITLAQHDTAEAIMIGKGAQLFKPQPTAIERAALHQRSDRTRNAQG